MILLLIFISFLPVVLLGLYIYNKDSVKEPRSLLIGLFSSGFLAVVFTLFIDIILALVIPDYYLATNKKFDYLTLFILVFFQVALVEEFFKWFMIRFIGYKHKDFDQLYDIIVYAVFVALGFAAIENFFYVFQGGFTTGVLRGIFSVPGHVAFGVFMGYYLGLAKMAEVKGNKKSYKKNMILSLIIPVCLHTAYNYCLMTENFFFLLIFLGFIIILYFSAITKVKEFSSVKGTLE